METETSLHNAELMGGPIMVVIRPLKDGNMTTPGSPAKVTIEYDEQNDRWLLICDDLVANVWQEYHPYLSHALLRLGVLARCAETNWDDFFAEAALGFIDPAEAFLQERTT